MSYPTFLIATLLEIDGSSCGAPKQELEWVANADPPEYQQGASGDFHIARCWREDLGGGTYTWRLFIHYVKSGDCSGEHEFVRNSQADDPTGDYCRVIGGMKDCDAGKAGVINDD